jgi:hypothetical protein
LACQAEDFTRGSSPRWALPVNAGPGSKRSPILDQDLVRFLDTRAARDACQRFELATSDEDAARAVAAFERVLAEMESV